MVYTTRYNANRATLVAILKNNDCVIVDMAVHASVYEGLLETNVKRFPITNLITWKGPCLMPNQSIRHEW